MKYSIYFCLIISATAQTRRPKRGTRDNSPCNPGEQRIFGSGSYYCGDQATKIISCLKKDNPNWPFGGGLTGQEGPEGVLVKNCSEKTGAVATPK